MYYVRSQPVKKAGVYMRGTHIETNPARSLRKNNRQTNNRRTDIEEQLPEDEYDDVWPVRMPSSARPYNKLDELQREYPDLPLSNTRAADFPIPQRRRSALPAAPKTNLPP